MVLSASALGSRASLGHGQSVADHGSQPVGRPLCGGTRELGGAEEVTHSVTGPCQVRDSRRSRLTRAIEQIEVPAEQPSSDLRVAAALARVGDDRDRGAECKHVEVAARCTNRVCRMTRRLVIYQSN